MARKGSLDPLLFTLFENKPSKGDQMRAEIIHTALKCIVSDGIANTGFESIAKKMGTRRSHVAYYFKDRDDILENVYRYLYRKTSTAVSSTLEEAQSPSEALERYLSSQFDWFGEEIIFLRAKVLFFYHAATHEPYRKLQAEVRSFGRKRLENILKMLPKHEKLGAKALTELADSVQSLIAGRLVFVVTTEEITDDTLRAARQATQNAIQKLIS